MRHRGGNQHRLVGCRAGDGDFRIERQIRPSPDRSQRHRVVGGAAWPVIVIRPHVRAVETPEIFASAPVQLSIARRVRPQIRCEPLHYLLFYRVVDDFGSKVVSRIRSRPSPLHRLERHRRSILAKLAEIQASVVCGIVRGPDFLNRRRHALALRNRRDVRPNHARVPVRIPVIAVPMAIVAAVRRIVVVMPGDDRLVLAGAVDARAIGGGGVRRVEGGRPRRTIHVAVSIGPAGIGRPQRIHEAALPIVGEKQQPDVGVVRRGRHQTVSVPARTDRISVSIDAHLDLGVRKPVRLARGDVVVGAFVALHVGNVVDRNAAGAGSLLNDRPEVVRHRGHRSPAVEVSQALDDRRLQRALYRGDGAIVRLTRRRRSGYRDVIARPPVLPEIVVWIVIASHPRVPGQHAPAHRDVERLRRDVQHR